MNTEPTPDVLVVGRVSIDLYAQPDRTPLEAATSYESMVGGFAGNVSIGLARLGAHPSIVSGVGDDGHGDFIRRALTAEGVCVDLLATHADNRTALAFVEIFPPADFPITYYRPSDCPDWDLRAEEFDWRRRHVQQARIVCLSGTGLAREPSRSFHRRVAEIDPSRNVLDLDLRLQLWPSEDDYARAVEIVLPDVSAVVGTERELTTATRARTVREAVRRILAADVETVLVKLPNGGATVVTRAGSIDVKPYPAPVLFGLGSGDAFLAASVAARLDGATWQEAAELGARARAIVVQRHGCSGAMPTRDELAEAA